MNTLALQIQRAGGFQEEGKAKCSLLVQYLNFSQLTAWHDCLLTDSNNNYYLLSAQNERHILRNLQYYLYLIYRTRYQSDQRASPNQATRKVTEQFYTQSRVLRLLLILFLQAERMISVIQPIFIEHCTRILEMSVKQNKTKQKKIPHY